MREEPAREFFVRRLSEGIARIAVAFFPKPVVVRLSDFKANEYAQLVGGRELVMLLPSGINKAVGTQRALDELGRSPRNLIAFGDAENDLPLLGSADDGTRAVLRPDGGNVPVSGDPRSGKSWVAGLAAEYVMEAGYRVCVFDPEGDHAAVGRRPGAIVLGREIALPRADDLGTVIADAGASLVVDLTSLPYAKKRQYVGRALASICAARARSGIPHTIIVDEAHHFFGAGAHPSADAAVQTGNVLLVRYRPSLIAPELLESIGAFILTQTTVEQERYFVDALLRTHGPAELDVSTALRAFESQRNGLLYREDGCPGGRRSCRGPACRRRRFTRGDTRTSRCPTGRDSSISPSARGECDLDLRDRSGQPVDTLFDPD